MSEQQVNSSKPKVLIFVHGMYGANLTNLRTGTFEYLSHGTLLRSFIMMRNKGHTSIASPTTWSENGKVQDNNDIIPTSIQTMFTKPWSVWTAAVDRSSSINVKVLDYIWDWRRPMDEMCDKFLDWIMKQGLSNDKRALLVSYSTGALLAWPAISQYPELFSGWVSVGGALGGGNFMLNDFENGWYNGPVCIFNAETILSFASCYVFFPAMGEPTGASCGYQLWKDSSTGAGVDVGDMFDIETWKRNNIGVYALRKKQGGREVTEADEEHLRNALASARRYREKYYVRPCAHSFDDPAFLANEKSMYSHLDIVCFGSDSFDGTHCGWHHDGETIRIDLDPVAGNGDGTVMTWAWKLVPGGLPYRVVYSTHSTTVHVALMTDKKVIEIVAAMLGVDHIKGEEGRRNGLGGCLITAAVVTAICALVVSLLGT